MTKEAMTLALEALEDENSLSKMKTARDILRKALAQPEQEPVAWMDIDGNIDCGLDAILNPDGYRPLYTTPPQRKPLTDGLPCCGYTDATAIKWNEFNHAVQCHNCGHTYTQTSNNPLTLDYIDQHIGADEGDREAVVALVREVEAAHGIKE
jgi:hypothetical protein